MGYKLHKLSLRARLTGITLTLVLVASTIMALASLITLDKYLTARLDGQINNSVARVRSVLVDHGGQDTSSLDRLFPPGSSSGTLVARIRTSSTSGAAQGSSSNSITPGKTGVTTASTIQAGILDDRGAAVAIDSKDTALIEAVSRDGNIHTLSLIEGDYRVKAITTQTGEIFMTGLPLGDVREAVLILGFGVGLVALSVLGLCSVGAWWTITGALKPLRRMASNAERISQLSLTDGDVNLSEKIDMTDAGDATEVGQVGASLNRMLEHISFALNAREAAQVKMRRFVSDASHELRTPLAVIRGYAEITRSMRGSTPELVAGALDKVESEAVRMTSLVEDLLLLARLDESREVPVGKVDLVKTAIEAVNDIRMLGADHEWLLDIEDDDLIVAGDPLRLRQILVNLLSNARIHTPAGTKVTTRVRGLRDVDKDCVEVVVEDNGPGIPAELLPDIFERFTRADSSRSRAQGSTGLGLSIVSGLVAAYGGDISISSEAGRTAFRVLLPRVR